jgi:transcription initiation factor TFIID subunit 15
VSISNEQGFIPAKQNMPSSMITFPQHNQDLGVNQTFQVAISVNNMELGFFTNAQQTYYSAPTELNGDGLIKGHTHITIQDLGGSFDPSGPLDPTRFAFFLGVNTPLSNGQVFANVPNGLPAGFYRACTMVANANHSPLQMPVAQRGNQDDCKYFSVGQTNDPVNGDGTSSSTQQDAEETSSTTTTASTSSTAVKSNAKKVKATNTSTSKAKANAKTTSKAKTKTKTSKAAKATTTSKA